MRRVLGFVLIGLGALFVGLGILGKPYLYQSLATIPLDQRSTSVSEGRGMNVLYPHVEDGAPAVDKLTLYDAVEKIYEAETVRSVGRAVAQALLNYFSRVVVFEGRDTAFKVVAYAGMSPTRTDGDLEDLPSMSSRTCFTASSDRRVESVRMYVMSAVWPSSPSSTPS